MSLPPSNLGGSPYGGRFAADKSRGSPRQERFVIWLLRILFGAVGLTIVLTASCIIRNKYAEYTYNANLPEMLEIVAEAETAVSADKSIANVKNVELPAPVVALRRGRNRDAYSVDAHVMYNLTADRRAVATSEALGIVLLEFSSHAGLNYEDAGGNPYASTREQCRIRIVDVKTRRFIAETTIVARSSVVVGGNQPEFFVDETEVFELLNDMPLRPN